LPVGPIEVSTVWYAQSRLASSTMGLHIWADGVNEMHTILSRVMEKTVTYTMAVLWDVLNKREGTATFDHFVLWSDGGSNLKNSTVIGTAGHDMLVKFGWTSAQLNFGAPKHFKTLIDGDFGTLTHVRHLASLRRMLCDVDDVVDVFQVHFAATAVRHPDQPKRFVYNFTPPEKASVPVSKFTLASCGGIRHSYSWTVTLNDKRRANTLRGRRPFHNRLTGLTLRNHGMTACRAVAEKTLHPELDDRVGDEAADDEGGEPMAVESLERDTKFYRGWRCSYCKVEEQAVKHNRFHSYLAKQCTELERQLRQRKQQSGRHMRGPPNAMAERKGRESCQTKTKRSESFLQICVAGRPPWLATALQARKRTAATARATAAATELNRAFGRLRLVCSEPPGRHTQRGFRWLQREQLHSEECGVAKQPGQATKHRAN